MAIRYNKLWKKLIDENMMKVDLRDQAGITTNALAKLGKNEHVKELLLYMYKNKRESGVFRLLNDMESLEMDDALVNDYLADLCEGKVNNWLIDYVDELYEEMEDIKKRKERKELLALIGNRSVLFDFDDFEDDENESYHKNMFESDDIEGGENL